jgi:hypothetical protein
MPCPQTPAWLSFCLQDAQNPMDAKQSHASEQVANAPKYDFSMHHIVTIDYLTNSYH